MKRSYSTIISILLTASLIAEDSVGTLVDDTSQFITKDLDSTKIITPELGVENCYAPPYDLTPNTPPSGLGIGEYGFNYFRLRATQAGSTSDIDNLKVIDLDSGETTYFNDFSENTNGLILKHNPVPNQKREIKSNFTWSVKDEVFEPKYTRIVEGKLRLESLGFNRNGSGGYNSYSQMINEDPLPENFELTFDTSRKQWAGHQRFHIFQNNKFDDEEWYKDTSAAVFRSNMGGSKLREAYLFDSNRTAINIRTGPSVLYPHFAYKLIKKGPTLSYFVNDVLIGTTDSLQRLKTTLEIPENSTIGTKIGRFDAYDEDKDQLTYQLVKGDGDTHNQFFQMDLDGTLKTSGILDYEKLGDQLTVRIQANDGRGGKIEEIFIITLLDNQNEKGTPPPAPGTGGLTPPDPDYKDTIAELKRLLAEKDKKLAHCETEMAAKEKQIGELTSTNAKLQGEVKSLNGKVTGLEQEVATLKSDNEGLKGQIQNLREDNQNISNELTVANNHLEEAIQVAETPFINGWVYDPVRGWLFTDAEHFPLVYTHNDQSWNYYELGSSEPRYFYNYTSQEWVAWDAAPEETQQIIASNNNL